MSPARTSRSATTLSLALAGCVFLSPACGGPDSRPIPAWEIPRRVTTEGASVPDDLPEPRHPSLAASGPGVGIALASEAPAMSTSQPSPPVDPALPPGR